MDSPTHDGTTGTGAAKLFQAGTLSYTKPALAVLVLWLFWGDFCYTVMEAVTGPIMQLKFQKFDASNIEIGVILVSIPQIIYTGLNPIISFKSDRFRSRWGRRIPFLVFSLPFLVLFLLCMAFGDQIGLWVASLNALKGVSSNQIIIATLGVFLVLFTIFNCFANSTFWYLFNDVVPEPLLARFMSWFRAISLISTSFYNFAIFPYSSSHSTEIFIGAALLYATGFGLMCYFVKEGKYPAPAPYVGGQTGPLAAVVTYTKGTHAFPHYWYMWLAAFFGRLGGGAAYAFNIYYLLAIGLSLKQIGLVNGFLTVEVGLLTLVAGWLADRYHPIRVVLIGNILGTFILTPLGLLWLVWHPSNTVIFWVVLLINVILGAPAGAMGGMWDPPMMMRLFPRSQYGQFCSANAIWCSLAGILGGFLIGVFLDCMTHWVGKEQAYYYMPAWTLFFGLPSFYFFFKLYLSWKKLGGDKSYVAPALAGNESPTPTPALAS